MKVLFIDDDPMILRMAGFIMKKAGHEAVTAGSGQEGLTLAERESPETVFIDVEMPGKNGFETLEEMTKLPGERRIFMMSGTVTEEVRARASELGALGVIDKPLSAPEVIEAVSV